MKKVKKLSLFTERVLNVVSSIKRGETMTYKEVATRAGSSGAARAVGSIMKANYRPNVPCHRVIRSDGNIRDYNRGGRGAKFNKLKSEGAIFKNIDYN